MGTEELLKKYGELSKEKGVERALWNLLKANEKHITGLIEEDSTGAWFHKAFRQIDVCENGHTDMAIWILIDESELFWEILNGKTKP